MPVRKGTKKTTAAKNKAVKKTAVKKNAVKKKVSKKKAVKKTVVKKKAAPKKAPAKRPAKAAAGDVKLGREEILKRLLRSKKEEIIKETQEEIAKYIKGENRQLVESALDDGDWSVIDLSEDINLRKLSNNKETIIKIDESLRKIDNQTYGLCEDCGEEINPERLKILPFAICCRDCQEAREEMEAAEKEERGRF